MSFPHEKADDEKRELLQARPLDPLRLPQTKQHPPLSTPRKATPQRKLKVAWMGLK
jgi:hypothetical protein